MSQRFTFNAYVLSVIDAKRICVRIDPKHLELVSARLTSATDKSTFKDTVVVNVNDSNFNIDFDWNELTDLIGVNVKINASTRKYCFYKSKTHYDENNEVRKIMMQCKGVAISAKIISTNVDNV